MLAHMIQHVFTFVNHTSSASFNMNHHPSCHLIDYSWQTRKLPEQRFLFSAFPVSFKASRVTTWTIVGGIIFSSAFYFMLGIALFSVPISPLPTMVDKFNSQNKPRSDHSIKIMIYHNKTKKKKNIIIRTDCWFVDSKHVTISSSIHFNSSYYKVSCTSQHTLINSANRIICQSNCRIKTKCKN